MTMSRVGLCISGVHVSHNLEFVAFSGIPLLICIVISRDVKIEFFT